MKTYLGVQLLYAEPMIFAEAVNCGLYRHKAQLDVATPGYHVRYKDGRETWIPASVFEKVYFQIEKESEITENDVSRYRRFNRYKGMDNVPAIVKIGLSFLLRWTKKNFKFYEV